MLHPRSTTYKKATYRESIQRKSMTGRKASASLFLALMILLCPAHDLLAAAEDVQKVSPPGISGQQLCEVLVAIAKMDSKLRLVWTSEFSIESGELKTSVQADKPTFYDGKSYQNDALQNSLYGQVDVTDKFYGTQMVIHYSLKRGGSPYGAVPVQERITVLYENMPRFNALRPRAFDSKAFVTSRDGTFDDLQVLGSYDQPPPEGMIQVVKQELLLANELLATIYIVRTPREIRIVGYSVPPLVAKLVLP
jgi:hypothetical protein